MDGNTTVREYTAHKMAMVLSDLASHKDGKPITDAERLMAFRRLAESGRMLSYVHLLPLALNLDGEPYSLEKFFPFESVFTVRLPQQLLMKTGRQVAKSTSLAARGLLISNAIPHFSTLFVTPLYEQIRRFSTNYVRKFIDQSPIKAMWTGTGTENSVLQRSFKNFSKMFFSFALTSADRVRGISAHANNFDEVQDMDPNLIPIIKETMSASKWRLSMYTGTPKTLEGTIQGLWDSSSQAEWCIPCPSCGKLNIPRMGYDLEKMIGPWHEGIGLLRPTPEQAEKGMGGVPGVVCANSKCRHWLDPETGRWIHGNNTKNKRYDFPGYHIPQIIMPMHYSDRKRWSELLAKQQGYGNTTMPQFYNEVLGESYDTGAKLLTRTDLKRASILPWKNEPLYAKEALKHKNDYILRVLGVDWGGGGESRFGAKKSPETMTMSFTTAAVLGLRPEGKLDVLYGRRLLTPHDHMEEAKQLLRIFHLFGCHFFAHDYNGAGELRETLMVQSGLPISRVAPLVYYRSAAQDIVVPHKSEWGHHRNYWQVDKARSLQFLAQCIKLQYVRFFQHDYVDDGNRGLQEDFLSLMENKVELPRAGEVYMIQRNPHFPDDFAHSVNFAACVIWHSTNKWPNVAQLAGLQVTVAQMEQIAPKQMWGENSGFFAQ